MESLGKEGEEEGRAKIGLVGVMGGWRGCGEEGKGGGESNGFEVGGGGVGGDWVRLSAAIGAV
jgi:hypothetical protein